MIVDPVYIVEQPKHITLTVIQVYDNYPKEAHQQAMIDKLSEISDVVFVFSGRREIDYKKFTTLHRSVGYVICKDGHTRAENILGIVHYFKELYKRHLSYIFVNDCSMSRDPKVFDKLQDWNASTITAPLMTIERVCEDFLATVYVPRYEKTWWGGTKRVYMKGCDYQTHFSVGPFIYMKDIVMQQILKKPKIEEYAKTFVDTEDPSSMLASLMVDLGVKTMKSYEI